MLVINDFICVGYCHSYWVSLDKHRACPLVNNSKISNGESNLADVIVDSPLIRLLTAFRFDPNTHPLSTFQQMGP